MDLHFKCPLRYPKSAPQVSLVNTQGLDETQLAEVKNNVGLLATEMIGDEMACQIAQNVSQMLADYNKAKRVTAKKDYASLAEAREASLAKERER